MFGGLSSVSRRGRRSGVFGSVLMATTALAVIAPTVAVAQSAGAQQSRQFDIPAQSLAQALMIFGRQAGLQVTAEGPLTEGKTSAVVRGDLSSGQALSLLLAGTGLTFRFVGRGGVHIERAPEAADGSIQLGPVRVQGEGGDRSERYTSLTSDANASEGTKSYTVKKATSATRMDLSLLETPQSVTVITRQKLDDLSLTEIGAALQSATGISVHRNSTNTATIMMRGFGVRRYLYDGMTLGPQITTNAISVESIPFDTAFYDRIEIVRGATGLTSGLGEPAGAVNFIRKRPTRELTGHLQLSGGNWDRYRAELDVSGPLNEAGTVRARAVSVYSDNKSFIDYYHRKTTSLYGIIEADVTPDLLVTAGATYSNMHIDGGSEGAPVPLFYADGSRTSFSRSLTTAPRWATDDVDPLTIFASAAYKLGSDWTAKAQYFYSRVGRNMRHQSINGYFDQISGTGMSVSTYATYYNSKENAVEFNIGGPVNIAGSEHKLIFGYTLDVVSAHQYWRFPSSVSSTNFYDRANWPEPAFAPASRWSDTRWREESIYGSAQVHLAKPLKLILGGRITNASYQGDEYKYTHRLTPYVGVVYNITDNLSAYASYTSIFQPQSVRDLDNNLLKTLTGTNYEAGVKVELFDGLMNISGAVFRIEQDNFAQYVSDVDGESRYRAVMGAKVNGFEVEASGEMAPGLNISAGFTHRNAGTDAEGQPVSTTSALDLLKLTASWNLPGKLDHATLGGNVNWQSRFYYVGSGPNGESPQQNAYGTLDIFANYQINSAVKLQININNVFDKTYYTGFNYSKGMYGEPRNVMISARMSM